jgi:hypothetical protein
VEYVAEGWRQFCLLLVQVSAYVPICSISQFSEAVCCDPVSSAAYLLTRQFDEQILPACWIADRRYAGEALGPISLSLFIRCCPEFSRTLVPIADLLKGHIENPMKRISQLSIRCVLLALP